MDVTSIVGLFAIIALVLANGFFVATEFAIVAVRRSRLEELAARGHAGARAAKQIAERLDTYIAACQLGITMASLALGWIGEPALAHLVEPPLTALIGHFAPAAAHGVAIGASFAFVTALHIILGELAPKGLALQRAEGTAIWVARPMQIFEFVFRWPIALLNGIGNAVLRLAGLRPAAGHELVHSIEELRLLVTGSREAGVVEESEARIATRAFTFADLTAGALMTPRTEVEAVPLDASLDELLERAAASRHHRLPVYAGSLDTIVGVLDTHDLLRIVKERPADFKLERIIRPAMVVPESKPADDILEEMRQRGSYFAVVIDEFGGTAGILTLEDLVEALVGPMKPEPAAAGTAAPPPAIVPQPDGSLLVDGLTRLDEWEEATGVRLEERDREQVETIGGVVMARLGRIPQLGDEVQIDGRTIRVEQLDGMRVALVRLLPPRAPVPAAPEPPRTPPA
jgi:CBS domain containing-hemolysin-like protein